MWSSCSLAWSCHHQDLPLLNFLSFPASPIPTFLPPAYRCSGQSRVHLHQHVTPRLSQFSRVSHTSSLHVVITGHKIFYCIPGLGCQAFLKCGLSCMNKYNARGRSSWKPAEQLPQSRISSVMCRLLLVVLICYSWPDRDSLDVTHSSGYICKHGSDTVHELMNCYFILLLPCFPFSNARKRWLLKPCFGTL